jgi:D-alanyl-D-alanine carboxypeptidase/D-alanyl-D-alanine-endopeptidase (penicillin-binding protein 4)
VAGQQTVTTPATWLRLLASIVGAGVLAVSVMVVAPVGAVATNSDDQPRPQTRPDLTLSTPVLSARRAPGLMANQTAQLALSTDLDAVLAGAPQDSCIMVSASESVLYRHNGDLPLTPASTMKLITATVAMDILGAGHRFTTSATSAADAVDGVIDGDLYLVGGGDPLLSTSGYAASLPDPLSRLTSPLEQLADDVVAAGVVAVAGSVVGDGSRYDDEVGVASWPASYRLGSTVGSLGALRVNAGRNGWADDPAAPAGGGDGGDPALLAAATFTRLLEARGVVVGGPAATATAPADSVVVAEMTSPRLDAMLDELLAWSDNGFAELLVKELGLAVSGQPTTEAGTAVVTSTLAGWGLGEGSTVIADGSGLDTGNRLTCDALVGTLEMADDDAAVLDGLARPGSPGTMWGRLTEPAAIGRVRAKTGTLDTVRALAGDVASAAVDRIRFAFITNGPPFAPGLTHDTADDVVRVLLEYPRRPDAALLSPVAPIPVR